VIHNKSLLWPTAEVTHLLQNSAKEIDRAIRGGF